MADNVSAIPQDRLGIDCICGQSQLIRKLQQVTEMAKPLLAKLPTVIDVTPGTPAEPQDAAVACCALMISIA